MSTVLLSTDRPPTTGRRPPVRPATVGRQLLALVCAVAAVAAIVVPTGLVLLVEGLCESDCGGTSLGTWLTVDGLGGALAAGIAWCALSLTAGRRLRGPRAWAASLALPLGGFAASAGAFVLFAKAGDGAAGEIVAASVLVLLAATVAVLLLGLARWAARS